MRLRTPACWLLALFALALASGIGTAQEAAEESEILRAVLLHTLDEARAHGHPIAGVVKYDPRIIEVNWSAGADPEPVAPLPGPPSLLTRSTERMAEITQGVAVPGVAAVECPTGPASCHVPGAEAVVATSEPVVRNGIAKVYVRTVRQTGSPHHPVAAGAYLLTLARSGGGWRVTEVELREVS